MKQCGTGIVTINKFTDYIIPELGILSDTIMQNKKIWVFIIGVRG
jgi:hypothetical protein